MSTQAAAVPFGPGYTRHQYREWLLTTVADLLDDSLAISSAGCCAAARSPGWRCPCPTITTSEGVAFRPNLLATTSFDGSIATTYKRTVTDTVCDNTRALALAEQGQEFKVKHSRHSRLHLAPARQALEMVHTLAEDFAAEVEMLCATPVNSAQWQEFLDRHVPRRAPRTGQMLEGRALTMADRKRGTLPILSGVGPSHARRRTRMSRESLQWLNTNTLIGCTATSHSTSLPRGESRQDSSVPKRLRSDCESRSASRRCSSRGAIRTSPTAAVCTAAARWAAGMDFSR